MRNQSELPSLAAVKTPISQETLDQLFREARTHSTWLPEPGEEPNAVLLRPTSRTKNVASQEL